MAYAALKAARRAGLAEHRRPADNLLRRALLGSDRISSVEC